MKLNHLNLCVTDLPEAILFFQHVFDFELTGQKGDVIAAMTDRHGFTLVLSRMRSNENGYPQDFHLGFYLDTTAEVDQFYRKLGAFGIASEQPPRMVRSGYTLYFTALGGILFEVTCYNQ